MKLHRAYHELWEIPGISERNVYQHIEKIGRLCYKSEDKITENSCFDFIAQLRDRKHWAMLEHYIFTLSVSEEVFNCITDRKWLTIDNPDLIQAMKFIYVTQWPDSPIPKYRYLVSGSATAFNNLWKSRVFGVMSESAHGTSGIATICKTLKYLYKQLMVDPWEYITGNIHEYNQYLAGDVHILSREEITNLPTNLRLLHDFVTVFFRVDRGVTHELVRHRPPSWAQESTRYCNYSKDKYGNEIHLIQPFFYEEDTPQFEIWKRTMEEVEKSYVELTKEHKSIAQEARSVLPNSTKADIVMTATLIQMIHFFNMRVPTTAHPQMREVTIPLLSEMQEKFPGIFNNVALNPS